MSVTRRKLLETMALSGAATLLPRFAFAQQPGPNGGFPPQAQIDASPLRPKYHLAPVRGWMNDPCAPVYFNNRYHLFFQNNPKASVWGNMSWAHAVSKDMVHWSLRPIALQPTPGGPDSFGVFTGTMIFDKAGVPNILYTCVSPSTQAEATLWGSKPPEREAQCIALPQGVTTAHPAGNPDATLDTWNKNPVPVIQSPPPGMKVTGFRDPVPWREDDGSYYMLLASGQKNIGGNVLLYKSPDLHQWAYQGIFAEGKATGKQTDDTVDSGETWECPDFFPLGDGKHVLIHSTGTATGRKTLWQSGVLDKATVKWTMEKEGVLNHGPYYAPKTQLDAHGNRILWGWIPEDWTEAQMTEHGWSGCMSLPRIMTLDAGGQARFVPAPEVNTLRGAAITDTVKDPQAEILFHIAPRSSGPHDSSRTLTTALIQFTSHEDPAMRTLRFNGEDIPLPENMPATFPIRCFVDHSLVEIFIGDAIVLTRRVYDGTPTVVTLPLTMQATPAHAYTLQSL